MEDVKTKVIVALALRGLEYGLKVISKYLHSEDFKRVADEVLNLAESKFKEDSLPDVAIEMACAQIREELGIKDSNPDN